MLVTFARRLLQRTPRGQRGMAGHGDYPPVPKPDTSMDHVFGDSSYKVDFDVRTRGQQQHHLGSFFWDMNIIYPPHYCAVQAPSDVEHVPPDSGVISRVRLPGVDDGVRREQDAELAVTVSLQAWVFTMRVCNNSAKKSGHNFLDALF